MRIAIYSDNFYPELSGISDSLIALAQELSSRGHFIHFFVPRYSKEDHTLSNVEHGELDLGPNVVITRFSSIYFGAGSGQGRLVIPCGRLSAIRTFKPDVIHTQTFFGVGLEALIASKLLRTRPENRPAGIADNFRARGEISRGGRLESPDEGISARSRKWTQDLRTLVSKAIFGTGSRIPLVGTNHTATKEFLRYNPLESEWSDNLVLRYVNWYYAQCVTVTAPSRSVFAEMDCSAFKKPGIAISNPIDTKTFHPLKNQDKLRKKFGVGEWTVMHAGRLAVERSIDVIIRALPLVKKKFPEAELMITGRGVAEKDLRALAAKLGVADSVKFLGFIEKNTLVEAYNAGKVFAITSTADTQSLVMMQAMACGIPVVGVRARALPEYINDTNGFVVEPGDFTALADRIIKLFKNEPLREKLGAGGRASALHYSPAAIADRWEKIYAEAASTANGK
jgi:glycosyltransferase involved in cell wall biosynthesis